MACAPPVEKPRPTEPPRTATCPPFAAVPASWRTVSDATGTYELRRPAGFAPREYATIHGGEAWERGDARITITFGYWAEHSFSGEPGQRCRVAVGDANVFVIVAPQRIIAWYDRGSRSAEPVIAVSSPNEAEVAALAPVVLSLRPRKAHVQR